MTFPVKVFWLLHVDTCVVTNTTITSAPSLRLGGPYWSTSTSTYLVVPIARIPLKDPVIEYLGFIYLPCLILLTPEWSQCLETNGRNSKSYGKPLYEVGGSQPCLTLKSGADAVVMSTAFEVAADNVEIFQSFAHHTQAHHWLWKPGESQMRKSWRLGNCLGGNSNHLFPF